MTAWDTHPDPRVRDIARRLVARGMFGEVCTIARRNYVSFDDIAGRGRTKAVTAGRHAVWVWMNETIGYSQSEVARLWGCDPSTVRGAIQKSREEGTRG